MTVTEITMLRLSQPLENLIPSLQSANMIYENHSGHKFRCFWLMGEDGTIGNELPPIAWPVIFLFGKWESVDAHRAFLESDGYRQILTLIRYYVYVSDMNGMSLMKTVYVEGDLFRAPPSKISVFDAPVLRMERQLVVSENKEAFIESIDDKIGEILTELTKPIGMVAGWSAEKASTGEEQWFQCTGFWSLYRERQVPKLRWIKSIELGVCEQSGGYKSWHLSAIQGL